MKFIFVLKSVNLFCREESEYVVVGWLIVVCIICGFNLKSVESEKRNFKNIF